MLPYYTIVVPASGCRDNGQGFCVSCPTVHTISQPVNVTTAVISVSTTAAGESRLVELVDRWGQPIR